jgi:hypothetical protein
MTLCGLHFARQAPIPARSVMTSGLLSAVVALRYHPSPWFTRRPLEAFPCASQTLSCFTVLDLTRVRAPESRDGGETFQRLSEAPVLGRNHHDPFLTGAPWVINESGRLRMWYISGTGWSQAPP